MDDLRAQIKQCRICAARFAQTATAHAPRPVPWFKASAKVLIAGQAPGARVHETGRPFTDRSGARLRDWLAVSEAAFYDQDLLAIVPMGFCFPGYNAKGADLPPPPICARTWRSLVLHEIGEVDLTILVGGAAMKWHLGARFNGVWDTVRDWRRFGGRIFPLPHPSWRNTAWLGKNPWFEAELLPDLRERLSEVLK